MVSVSKKIYLPIQVVTVFSAFLFFTSCRSGKETVKTGKKESRDNKIEAKYSSLLGVDEKYITNTSLYFFIDEWYGTPYKYGGKDKKGIDCSNFISLINQKVYKRMITGSSSSIFEQCKVISKNDLKEGDLVFFKIEKDKISHVGVYLQNNKFVHATTKKGVMIDDLDEAYYKKYFYKAGRIK